MREGSPVRLVFYTDKGAVAIKGTIGTREPLVVVSNSSDGKIVAEGNRVLVVLFDRGQFFKAEAQVVVVQPTEGYFSFTLSDQMWEEVDRRKFPRYDVSVPVSVRAIHEAEGVSELRQHDGVTADMSVGGAWVTTEDTVEPGSLIEFEAELSPKDRIRILGIVAHSFSERQGFGVEFLDYVGSARYTLHTFLASKAA